MLNFLGTVALIYFAYKAWGAAQGQHDEAKLANRPWVDAQIELDSGFEDWFSNTYRLGLKLTIKNIGKSPAQKVRAMADHYFGDVYERSEIAEMVVRQEQLCKDFRGDKIWPETPAAILFPDQVSTQRVGIEFPKDRWQEILKSKKDVTTAVLGCVHYFSTDGKAHRTFFAFSVAPLEKDKASRDYLYTRAPTLYGRKLNLDKSSEPELITID